MVLVQRAAEKSSRLGRISCSPFFARFFVIDCYCVSLATACFIPSNIVTIVAGEEEEKAPNYDLTEYDLMCSRTIGSGL